MTSKLHEVILEFFFLGTIPAIVAIIFSYFFFRKRTEYSAIIDSYQRVKLEKGYRYLIGLSIIFIGINIATGVFTVERSKVFYRDYHDQGQSFFYS